MSTRSLTHIKEDGKTLLTFYRHSDGYPSGHGAELAKFLNGFQIVNGLTGKPGKIANGMGCLAAAIIAHFKDGPGQIYIYPADAKGDDSDAEYIYTVTGEVGQSPKLAIRDVDGTEIVSLREPAAALLAIKPT